MMTTLNQNSSNPWTIGAYLGLTGRTSEKWSDDEIKTEFLNLGLTGRALDEWSDENIGLMGRTNGAMIQSNHDSLD